MDVGDARTELDQHGREGSGWTPRILKPPSRTGRTALLSALCLAAAAAGAVTPAGGQASQPSAAELRRLAELVNKPVVYTVPGMDRVKVRKDIVYKNTDDPNMKLD